MADRRGLHEYRFASNPEEQRFAEAWRLEHRGDILGYLLGDGRYPVIPSERDHVVAATVVQWLGSPVGQCFLRDLGYAKKEPDE